jgi:acyl-CoA synthetase (AMP-forming)/AMP-acid ligase II
VLEDDSTILGTLSYGELAKRARDIAAGLVERDIVPGDRVALMLPTSIDFFVSFFGVLYAGAIPVPIYPPMNEPRSKILRAARPGFCAMREPDCSLRYPRRPGLGRS